METVRVVIILNKFELSVWFSKLRPVVAFAGDALVCVFHTRFASPAFACLSAILCADKLNKHAQSRARKKTRGDTLSAHFALAYGDLKFAALGMKFYAPTSLFYTPVLSEGFTAIHPLAL